MLDELVRKLDFWAAFGLVAQLAFTARFVVQWIASERAKRSVVPLAFWYFSLFGSTGLLLYAIVRADPIFILGQGLGSFIYLRNLTLIYRERRGGPATQEETAT
ncbi:MAG: lipid A biosynthesis protein [Planctomycetes bacterium SM23_25]|nr:MAG: lipid A biosynthesis protein [Planctomycetes bacterium DG_20]KPK50771.1 MAG: lipid A biosynthesis protein [Planctomycetes bacterium SM23_25]